MAPHAAMFATMLKALARVAATVIIRVSRFFYVTELVRQDAGQFCAVESAHNPRVTATAACSGFRRWRKH